jgi:hypothetical protein
MVCLEFWCVWKFEGGEEWKVRGEGEGRGMITPSPCLDVLKIK